MWLCMGSHAAHFPYLSLGMSQGSEKYFMSTQQVALMPRIAGPSVVSLASLLGVQSYRDAVRLGWNNRSNAKMTRSGLCEKTGMRASHVVDYLNEKTLDHHGKELRDIPAKYVPAFEQAVGNTCVSQWLAMQSNLTILEAVSSSAQ